LSGQAGLRIVADPLPRALFAVKLAAGQAIFTPGDKFSLSIMNRTAADAAGGRTFCIITLLSDTVI